MRVRVVIDWLEHDRRRCAVGDVLDLSDGAAEQLIAVGAVERVVDGPPEPAPGGEEPPLELPRTVGRRRRG